MCCMQAFSDIKNYYNDITHNNLDLIKTLKEDVAEMKKKDNQNEKLMFEIAQENKRLSEPLQKVRSCANMRGHELLAVQIRPQCRSLVVVSMMMLITKLSFALNSINSKTGRSASTQVLLVIAACCVLTESQVYRILYYLQTAPAVDVQCAVCYSNMISISLSTLLTT